MACQQKVRLSQDAQLLPNQVLSEQQSLVVIKKLLAIAVSGIMYLRGLFPEDAFGSKYVEDQKVMILREEHNCHGATQIVHWMQGCFEAIHKKYLRTVLLSIYTDPEKPQKVTEFYQFRIQYAASGGQVAIESTNNKMTMSCSNIRKASILLVRKLYTLMQNLGPLPDNVSLSMKLAYYEDVTPLDYQPPGFKETDGNTMEFEREPVKLTMGEVTTPFHTLRLVMATERQRLEEVEESVHVTEKWILTMKEGAVLQSQVIEDSGKPENDGTDTESTDIQMICEKIRSSEEATKVDSLLKKTSDMEASLKRTRIGQIKSTVETNLFVNSKKPAAKMDRTISQFEIPSSQETPASSKPRKKCKFSEPKERF